MEIDTTNLQLVCLTGDDKIGVMMPRQKMTKQEALVHAAWLVVLADENDNFQKVLAAVKNT